MEMQLLPPLFSDMFVKHSDVYNYPTRHAHNLRVTSNHKTILSEQFIRTAATSIWNHICLSEYQLFKMYLKIKT